MPRDVAREGNGALALTGGSQALVAANPNRAQITICNPAASNVMWLAYSDPPGTTGTVVAPTAAANTGIRLGPGQSMVETVYRGAIAILGTAADVVTFIEL